MELTTVWFILIAVLWIGYFTLEGFDFGVGMLLPVLAKDETERRVHGQHDRPGLGRQRGLGARRGRRDVRRVPGVVRHPLQRLLPATAADPGRPDRARARLRVPPQSRRGELEGTVGPGADLGSLVPAFLWGVAFANIVHGVPSTRTRSTPATCFTLLNPYGLLGGAGDARLSSSPTARCSSR